MPRIFHTTVYQDQLAGNAIVQTDAQLNEMLGRADSMSVYLRAAGAVGTGNLELRLAGSNDGIYWRQVQQLTPGGGQSVGTLFDIFYEVSGSPLPAFLRFELNFTSADSAAQVTLSVCGRTE